MTTGRINQVTMFSIAPRQKIYSSLQQNKPLHMRLWSSSEVKLVHKCTDRQLERTSESTQCTSGFWPTVQPSTNLQRPNSFCKRQSVKIYTFIFPRLQGPLTRWG